ncbi:MAG: four helix bundle protein [Myxococcaceae bacterium]
MGTGTGTETGKKAVFDHEKLDVYWVAREFLEMATGFIQQKMPRDLRDQFDRASVSILANIGEGAGKMARADKQRFYEVARGSTTETATLLEIMRIRGIIATAQYDRARVLLLRVAQMLSRLCAGPRTT